MAAQAEAPGFTATRWLPAAPTYAISSHSITDLQRAVRDVAGSFGALVGVRESDISEGLSRILGVDPLSVEALRQIGVDPEGGFALFSDDIDPTIAVHLSQPDALPAFFDRLHLKGMISQSVIVDGSEIFSTQLGRGTAISWVVQGDWLLVHLAIKGVVDDNKSWVAASKKHEGGWLDAWNWANRVGAKLADKPGVLGFLDLHKLVAASVRGADAVACVELLAPIQRVGFAIDGNGRSGGGQISFELGAGAKGVAAALLPEPSGWHAASANAPISVAWNLDLARVADWIAPCAGAVGVTRDLAKLRDTGVRAARAFASAIDISGLSGVGAVSLELASTKLITEQLDRVPMRGTLERDRTWNGTAGHHLGIPFGPTVDYVLDGHRAILAMGDDTMAKVLATGTPGPARLASVDIIPGGLSKDVWKTLFDLVDFHHRAADALLAWHDGHIALTLDGSTLVFEARGNRR